VLLDLAKLRLANRTEALLRTDRTALHRRRQCQNEPALLLALLPENGAVTTLMDSCLPDIAERAGLQYNRLLGSETRAIPHALLHRADLILADLTGRPEEVVTLIYQAIAAGRRILLSGQSPEDFPPDLDALHQVLYESSETTLLVEAVSHALSAAVGPTP
jgi:hypothetical protein